MIEYKNELNYLATKRHYTTMLFKSKLYSAKRARIATQLYEGIHYSDNQSTATVSGGGSYSNATNAE